MSTNNVDLLYQIIGIKDVENGILRQRMAEMQKEIDRLNGELKLKGDSNELRSDGNETAEE